VKQSTTDRTKQKTVATELVSWLGQNGIHHVFGVPSGAWLPYSEAMRIGDVEFVLVTNETAAGFMAVAYSWVRDVPGACYATIGPGATNLSTGIGAAYLNRTPMIALTTEGDGSMIGRTVQMGIDQQALMIPITKETMRLKPETLVSTLDRAYSIATAERPGPVHIGIPDEFGNAPVHHTTSGLGAVTPQVSPPPEEALTAMEGAFIGSKKPILAIGIGAVRAGSVDAIRQIAERHGIPVVLTPMAKGMLSEDHPSYAGVLFHALSDHVALTHKQADLVVGVGYDPVEFNYESWMPSVPLVSIDTEPADIDRSQYNDVIDVVGAIDVALERLVKLPAISSDWDFAALAKRRAEMFSLFEPEADTFGPVAVLKELREQLPEDGIMTCDVGAHTHLIGQMWRTPAPRKQLMDNGWSSMGFGVPSAIGAKVGRPDLEVACVTGDGGFMMMAGEMATAVRLGHRIVFVLLSDRSLELINLKQKKRNLGHYGTSLFPADAQPTETTSLFDVPVIPAHDVDSFRTALKKAFETDGPTIVQAFVDASDYQKLILKKHK
jgi:acetolactate synthase-1/2/3 large subunit